MKRDAAKLGVPQIFSLSLAGAPGPASSPEFRRGKEKVRVRARAADAGSRSPGTCSVCGCGCVKGARQREQLNYPLRQQQDRTTMDITDRV